MNKQTKIKLYSIQFTNYFQLPVHNYSELFWLIFKGEGGGWKSMSILHTLLCHPHMYIPMTSHRHRHTHWHTYMYTNTYTHRQTYIHIQSQILVSDCEYRNTHTRAWGKLYYKTNKIILIYILCLPFCHINEL